MISIVIMYTFISLFSCASSSKVVSNPGNNIIKSLELPENEKGMLSSIISSLFSFIHRPQRCMLSRCRITFETEIDPKRISLSFDKPDRRSYPTELTNNRSHEPNLEDRDNSRNIIEVPFLHPLQFPCS